MPDLRYEALQRALRTPAGGVFFFHGEEEFVREEAVSRVIAAHVDAGTRDFNLDQVRGAEVAPEALASVIGTPPLMAEWRVVVVRDAQGLSPKAREVVEAALRAPPAGLALVVSCAIPSGSKARFYDELRKRATSVEFTALAVDDAPGWLVDAAAEVHGMEMDFEAARAVVAGIGVDQGTLHSELRKLADYAAERRRITLADVEAVGGSLPKADRWAWFDLVAERRFDEALAALPILLEQGENGVGLVIGLGGQLLKVALVCAGGPAALEKELKPFQRWMARRLVPVARRWTLAEADAALGELLRTDRLLKSASLTDRQAMEELLLRLWAIRPADAAA